MGGGHSQSPSQPTVPGSGRLRAQSLEVDAPLGRLSAVYPPALDLSFTVHTRPVTLGREPEDGTPPLSEPTVSRRHLVVEWDRASATRLAVDLGSRNGTWIDGHRLTGRAPLEPGSVLRIGHAILVYESASFGAPLPWVEPTLPVSHDAIPGQSTAAHELRATVARAAPDPSPALIVGETGTGKELIASELHRLSGRSGPIVPLNCAALSPQLVESQLFGHVRGAFTGAQQAQEGMVRAADGGTLFLDEIGELPLPLQAKLLRLIQEGEVHPIGSPRATTVNVRVAAATNRDLGAAADAGAFRRDLYARLALWEIRVPPLRARRRDILSWVERLQRSWRQRRGLLLDPLVFEPLAAEALLLADWPENLRGVDRLVHELSDAAAPITLEQLPPWFKAGAPGEAGREERPPSSTPSREELEAALLALGSVRATAKHFGRDRRQIYRWMEAYGIEKKR